MLRQITANHHTIDVLAFRQALLDWGKLHFRPFPWRLTADPYNNLMAELMLHRTQASQVVPIYERFIAQYPNITSLAQASINDLHTILYSLGLRWRIDLIHTLSQVLIERYAGKIPYDKSDLLTLPGVSHYIASAVRCFSRNEAEALIDTNTVRIIGRLFGLEIKDSSRRNQLFRGLITTLVDPDAPRAYNYALLDLGDRICTKKRQPDCEHCPVATLCRYGIIIHSTYSQPPTPNEETSTLRLSQDLNS